MFEEKLTIMDRVSQVIANQTVVVWQEGAEITAKMQISNMPETLIASSQGVVPTGYLVVDMECQSHITVNTYLKHSKSGRYIRVIDDGVVEAGEGFFGERQYAVESVTVLPS